MKEQVKRSPRAKMVYVEELGALVQEDLLPDILSQREASPETDTPGADCRQEEVSGRSGAAGGLSMAWWKRRNVSYPSPGEKCVIRKGHAVYVHEDLFGARWGLTIAERNKKNRLNCDWLIKVAKELKSFYPHGEKQMSDADSATAASRIDMMIKVLKSLKQEELVYGCKRIKNK